MKTESLRLIRKAAKRTMSEPEKLAALLEALQTEMIVNQALIDVLVDKGVLSHDELQAKIKKIRIESGIVLSGSGTSTGN